MQQNLLNYGCQLNAYLLQSPRTFHTYLIYCGLCTVNYSAPGPYEFEGYGDKKLSTYLNADGADADEITEVYAAACSFESAETCNSGSWSSSLLALTLHTRSTNVILLHICVYRFTSITVLYCHCTFALSMLTRTVKCCPLELTYNSLQNGICILKGKENYTKKC
jgi:hypothetical protein